MTIEGMEGLKDRKAMRTLTTEFSIGPCNKDCNHYLLQSSTINYFKLRSTVT